MKAGTSQFGFISSLPLLQDTLLHSPQPRLIFMQRLRLAGTVPKARCVVLGCFLVTSAAVTGQRLHCPEAPASPRGVSVPQFLGFEVAIQRSTNSPSSSC